MTLRRVIIHALLPLLLLMSQQAGLMHRISHWQNQNVTFKLSKRLSDPSSLPGQNAERLCEQCLFFAQVGSALTADGYRFAAVNVGDIHERGLLGNEFSALFFTSYHSRAPPLPSL